ncbi:hypothetical protein BGZ82_009389 [Podila clonocystis]|nr:hypothetical protein BGZ82_009389 [Podila clonocystis]
MAEQYRHNNTKLCIHCASSHQGYCVYEIEYGVSLYGALIGIKDIRDSAKKLSVFVDRVMLETKAPKVDIL